MFKKEPIVIEELSEDSFEGIDLAFFSAGGSVSLKYAPIAVSKGAVVIDNTSAFRMDPTIPLVVPEVNAHVLSKKYAINCEPKLFNYSISGGT